MSDSYLPVHPMTMRLDTVLPFEVFIGDEEDSYTSFHTADEPYTAEVHGRVFNESIDVVYIRETDRKRYHRYLAKVLPAVLADPFIDEQSRADIIHRLLTCCAESIFEKPLKTRIQRFRKIVIAVTGYLLRTDEAIPNLIARTRSSFLDADHLVNVGIYGMGLARELLDPASDNMGEVAAGFFLHDIGRHDIPRAILEKNGPLTDAEWEVVKRHPQSGFELLQSLGPVPEESKTIIMQHHERHDGNGYPLGLTGDRIHTYSKICTIADAFDALTSHRPFRSAHTSFAALKIMREEMRNEFDPAFFSRFVMLFSSDRKMTIDRSRA